MGYGSSGRRDLIGGCGRASGTQIPQRYHEKVGVHSLHHPLAHLEPCPISCVTGLRSLYDGVVVCVVYLRAQWHIRGRGNFHISGSTSLLLRDIAASACAQTTPGEWCMG